MRENHVIKCKLCRWLRKHTGAECIAGRPEVQAKFRAWRSAQVDDRALFTDDPQRERLESAISIRKSDPTAAFPSYLALAQDGSVWSMLCVGWFYHTGVGVAVNFVEAERWYQLASQHGSRRASLYLADLYVSQSNFDACEKLLQPFVDNHWVPAIYALAMAKLKQPKTKRLRESARILLEEAVACGDIGAQVELAVRMVRGWFGWRRIPRGFSIMSDACDKTLALVNEKHRTPSQQPADAI